MHRSAPLAALWLLSAGCATQDALTTRLDHFRLHAASAPLAGVAVAQRDARGHIRSAAVGCAQFAADGSRCRAPLAADTLLRAASISKLATTLGVMRLIEAQRLDLDRDVSDYLGFSLRNPAFPDRAITLRQLLAHSSSLIDGDVYWAAYPQTLQQLLAGAAHFDAAQVPGSCYRYTNLNFGVIGSVIERVSGQRFDVFMRQQVFAPAGIEAGFNWSGLEAVAPQRVGGIWRQDAQGRWQAQLDDFGGAPPMLRVLHSAADKPGAAADATESAAPPADYPIGSNGTLFSPQGGMRISVEGLLRLGAQLLPARFTRGAAPLLSDASIEALLAAAEPPLLLPDCDRGQQPPSRRYGLGVEVLQFVPVKGPRWVGHFGEAYGLRSTVIVDRKRGTVRAYIINGSAQPLPAAAAPYVEMTEPEAALLRNWPLR